MKHVHLCVLSVALTLVAPAASAGDSPKKTAQKAAPKTPKKPGKKRAEPVETLPTKAEEPPKAPETKAAETTTTAAPVAKETKDAPPKDAPPKEEEKVRPISVAPVLGYATGDLRLGVGIRAGYTFENRVYVGGTFVYHFGHSEDVPALGGKVESSVSIFYPGVEGGYDLPVGPVVVRPYGGVGVAFAHVSLSQGDKSKGDTKSSLALWPGVAATYAIPSTSAGSFFVGADMRLVIATEGGDPSFGMFLTGGMRL